MYPQMRLVAGLPGSRRPRPASQEEQRERGQQRLGRSSVASAAVSAPDMTVPALTASPLYRPFGLTAAAGAAAAPERIRDARNGTRPGRGRPVTLPRPSAAPPPSCLIRKVRT